MRPELLKPDFSGALGLTLAERHIRGIQLRSSYWLPLVAIVTQAMTQLESSPLLLMVSTLRSALLIVPLWLLTERMSFKRQRASSSGAMADVRGYAPAITTRNSHPPR